MVEKQSKREEEVSFRDLVNKIWEYVTEIYLYRKWIGIVSIVLMTIAGIYSFSKKPVFEADLSFMINEDSGNPFGSISGVLGTFGIEARDKNNLAKVLELSKSRQIIENAIFNSSDIGGREDMLANHLITYWDTLDQWNSRRWYQFYRKLDDSLTNFQFTHHVTRQFRPVENKALKRIFEKIAGNPEIENSGMLKNFHNPASRIMHLKVESKNPDLSISLCNSLFDELGTFYVEKSIEKQKATYDILLNKTDSLRHLIEQKENQLARFEDSRMGSYSSKSKLQEQRLKKDIQLLTIALGESIKNLEIADFSLKNTTPFIQEIDRPVNPLTPIKPGLLKFGILGFILGLFLSAFLIALRKMFRDAMRS